MPSRRKLAVLTHAKDQLETGNYLLNLLIDAWRESGVDVSVLLGPGHYQPADAVVLHVDRTFVPPEYGTLARRYPRAVNGRVHDISKRKISANLLREGDSYTGEVIVKTDLNFGGTPERKREPRGAFQRALAKQLPWTWTGNLSPETYPIYPSPAAVPRAVWRNPRLVVEKYLPEREGELYALRQWVFLGDRGFNQRVFSREPVIKSGNVIDREYDVPVPDALRAKRAELGFDYGKFDYVLVDGEAVLLDANKTPSASRSNPSPRLRAIVEELAQGLELRTGTGSTAG